MQTIEMTLTTPRISGIPRSFPLNNDLSRSVRKRSVADVSASPLGAICDEATKGFD